MSLVKVLRGSSIPRLPDDIIFNEILPRVPSEVLHTWRFVCKSWFHQLYSNSTFINAQLSISQSSFIFRNLGFCYNLRSEVKFEFDDTSRALASSSRALASFILNDKIPTKSKIFSVGTQIQLMGACNGLILLNRYSSCSTHIVNPATKEWVTLPSTDIKYISTGGLCYDTSSEKYKAVFLFGGLVDKRDKETPYWWCEILSLGEENWRKVKYPFVSNWLDFPSVLAGGFMHFGSDQCVISMDVANETFHKREAPCRFFYLFKLGDCLALSSHDDDDARSYRIDIWILKDDGQDIWSRKHRILLDGDYIAIFSAIASVKNGEVIIFDAWFGKRLFYYDTLNKTLGEVATDWMHGDGDFCQIRIISEHVSTLVSPSIVAGGMQFEEIEEGWTPGSF